MIQITDQSLIPQFAGQVVAFTVDDDAYFDYEFDCWRNPALGAESKIRYGVVSEQPSRWRPNGSAGHSLYRVVGQDVAWSACALLDQFLKRSVVHMRLATEDERAQNFVGFPKWRSVF